MFENPENSYPKGWRKILAFDWILLGFIAALVGIGLLMLYGVANGDPSEWMYGQAQRAVLGMAVMFFIAFVPLKLWQYCTIPIYLSTLGLLVLTLLVGIEGGGAARWVALGPIRIQPSEFAKVSVLLAIAHYYAVANPKKISHPLYLIPPILLALIPAGLVVIQPDLGTALIIVILGAAMMFLAGVHWAYYGVGIFIGALAVPIIGIGLYFFEPETACKVEMEPYSQWLTELSTSPIGEAVRPNIEWAIKPYQYERIFTFMHPECDIKGDGWQIYQGNIALGAGGMNGRGFMQGTQSRLNFLSENHTDFIFTSYAENFGFIGTVVLLVLFGLASAKLGLASIYNKTRFGALVLGGVSTLLFMFYMINLAMVMGLMPVVGVPLPFISYGGSAMLVLFIALGFAQSAHIHRPRRNLG